jgi:hypothetical protein
MAEQRGESPLLRAALVAKAMDTDGSGRVSRGAFVAALAGFIGQHPANIRKLLPRGEGRYWAQGNGWLYLFSFDRVAQNLGIPNAGQQQFEYPVELLRGGIARFRALLCNAQLPGKAKHMSREAVRNRTGCAPSTVRRWEREGLAVHSDGSGNVPLRAPKVLVDYSGVLACFDPAGALSMEFLVTSTVTDDRVQRAGGFFGTDRHHLLRESAKPFQSNGRASHRRIQPRYRANSSSFSAEMGKAGMVRVRIPGGGYRFAPRDGVVFLPVANGIRGTVPVALLTGSPAPVRPNLSAMLGIKE